MKILSYSAKVASIPSIIRPEEVSGSMPSEIERELITERVNAGIAAAKQNGTRFGRPPLNPAQIAEKLQIAQDARAKGRTAEQAAALVGWSRATVPPPTSRPNPQHRHRAHKNGITALRLSGR